MKIKGEQNSANLLAGNQEMVYYYLHTCTRRVFSSAYCTLYSKYQVYGQLRTPSDPTTQKSKESATSDIGGTVLYARTRLHFLVERVLVQLEVEHIAGHDLDHCVRCSLHLHLFFPGVQNVKRVESLLLVAPKGVRCGQRRGIGVNDGHSPRHHSNRIYNCRSI